MRPTRLCVEGIKSFYTRTEIDFETLSGGGIFGIFGDTGSGKSSIVDCIIFALYGATTNSGVKLEDFINAKSTTGKIELEFSIAALGGETEHYLIERTLSVKRSKNSAVTHSAELFDITGPTRSLARDSSKVNTAVAKLIGLKLGDFCNCIVLEQGKYDSFVSSTDKERKEIIGNIFGLQKFGKQLAEAVKERETELKVKRSAVDAKIGEKGDVTEDAIAELDGTLKSARYNLESVAKDIAALEVKERDLGRYRAAYENSRQMETKKAELQRLLPALKQKHGYACQKQRAAAEEYRTKSVLYKDRSQAAVSRKAELSANAAVAEDRKKAACELEEIVGALTVAQREEESAKNRAAMLRINTESYRDSVSRGLERFFEETGEDYRSENWENIPIRLATYAQALSAQAEDYKRTTENIKITEARKQQLIAAIAAVEGDLKAAKQNFELSESDCAHCKRALAQAQSALMDATRQNAVVNLVRSLHEGDNCPVCGSVVHTLPHANAEDLETKESEILACESRLKASEEKNADSAEEAKKLDREMLALVKDKDAVLDKLDELSADLRRIRAGAGAQTLLERTENFKTKLTQLVDKDRADSAELVRAEQNRQLSAASVQSKTVQADSLIHRLSLMDGALSRLVPAGSTFADETKKAEAQIADCETKVFALDRDLKAAEQEERTCSELMKNAEAQLAAVEEQLTAVSAADFDENAYAAVKAQLDHARADKEELVKKVALSERTLLDSKIRLLQLEQLKKEQSALLRTLDNLDRIKKMTGAGKLLEWIAEEYIEDFTEDAGKKLSDLTNGEMDLKYTRDGFCIVDNFNNGEERKVATVSGGETFLVSLSLAIAISKRLQQRADARPIEFLFIDEGFGTLSQNKIDVVMDALDNLAKDNFVVGLISHVTEMQSRLPHQLLVKRNDSDTGSVVTLI